MYEMNEDVLSCTKCHKSNGKTEIQTFNAMRAYNIIENENKVSMHYF